MDYDFFDDQKEIIEADEKPVRPTEEVFPEGEGYYNGAPKKKKWWKIALTVGLSLLVFFVGYFTCWLTLDKEMRTLIKVKDRIQEDYYKEIDDDTFYKAIFGAINDGLLDKYSEYMTPEEFEASLLEMEGNRSGLGLIFSTAKEEDELLIRRVCGNSPAEEKGILVGERIIACGKDEGSLAPCSKFKEFSDFLEEYDEGEEFALRLQFGESERVITVSKKAYVENYVFYKTKTAAYAFDTENGAPKAGVKPFDFLPDDTAYIQLLQFTGNASDAFVQAMNLFKQDGKKHLVLDLRGNGGGYLDQMQTIASYFCKNTTEKKPFVAIADFGDKQQGYRADGNYYNDYFAADSRIVVLADNGTASASECLIGSMYDYGAITYGDICLAYRGAEAKTYGKGIMQETQIVSLFDGDALKLTTAEIRWPLSKKSIHDVGVLPAEGALTVEENLDYEKETQAAIAKLFG